MDLIITDIPFRGSPFYFCNSGQFYYQKQCDGQTLLVPPKKAIVYNKPEYKMSKLELKKWASRNRYR